jgi:hypothetical protein
MEQFSALRIMAEDEALDVRNRNAVLMLDRCSACGRELVTRLTIPHYDGCDMGLTPSTPSVPKLPWWKRLLS